MEILGNASNLYNYLFNTRQGLLVLVVVGVIVFAIAAFVLERGTRAKFPNRPEAPKEERAEKAADSAKAAAKAAAKQASRTEQAVDKIAEDGVAGLLGIDLDLDDEDD